MVLTMIHLKLDDIKMNGVQWNREWILSAGANHWLSSCWTVIHQKSLNFVDTSCEVTAASIRWKTGLGDEWKLVDDGYQFEDIEKQSPYFQVSIGEDWNDCEHIVTIWDGHLVQSYYQKYSIRISLIDDVVRNAFNNISDDGNYEIVTGVPISRLGKIKIHYWLPPGF